MKKKFKRNKIK